MDEKEQELFDKTMAMLNEMWFQNESRLHYLHGQSMGIRSTQIGALIILLIKLGVIHDKE